VRVFYGFPNKKQRVNPYPALCDDAKYGGSIVCELADGREITIERLGINKKSHFSIIDNASQQELAFENVFGHNESFYRKIYALTLQQLATGGVLEEKDNEISSRLYGMNYTAKNVDINHLIQKLSSASGEIYLSKGRNQELVCQYELLKSKQLELQQLEDKLHQSEKLDLEIAELEKKLKNTSYRCDALTDYLMLKRNFSELEAKIAEMKQRSDALVYSQTFLDNESVIEELSQSIKLNHEYHNNLLVSKIELETLEKELRHADNEFDKVVEDDIFQHKLMDFGLKDEQAIRKDKENGDYNIRLDVKRNSIFATIQMLIMFTIIGILGGFLMYNFGNQEYGRLLIIGCSIVCALLIGSRVVLQKFMKNRPTDYAENLQLEFIEFLQAAGLEKDYSIASAVNKFTEARHVAKEYNKLLLIKDDYRQKQAQLEAMSADLAAICHKLNYPYDREKSYEDTVIQLKAELKKYQMMLASKNALNIELKKELSLHDELKNKIKQAETELQKLELDGWSEENLQQLKKDFYSLNALTAVKRNEYAELLTQDELEIVKSDFASLKNQAKKMVDKYLTLELTLKYIEKGIEKFEQEHQGEIINKAAEYFSYISNNRYSRVKKSLQKGDIVCVTVDNKTRTLSELSTGTREQLLLAIRLSLIEYIEKECEPLPLILDDVFVNFDYQRKIKMEEIIEKFAKNRQVLVFKLANQDK
jgi:uncharacterized protein YhaN